MALPQTPKQWDAAAKAIQLHAVQQRQLILDLYGQWVSELEPELIYTDFLSGPKGLAVAGDTTRTIVVRNPHWQPGFLDMLKDCNTS